MLEIRKYTIAEMREILHSRGKQAIERKLNNYDVEFATEGRGRSAVFDITAINDPFKVYCIVELGFVGQTDFKKLRDFYYCFLNDDEFMSMPDEVKEARMRRMGYIISRQTIANYTAKLERKEFLYRDYRNFYYYFAHEGYQRMVEKAEYCKAWKEHWARVNENGWDRRLSIHKMITDYGGLARKQGKLSKNAIYLETIDYINDLIVGSMEKEYNSFKSDI